MSITQQYAFNGLNTEFVEFIHSRLFLINNEDSAFIEAIDTDSKINRLTAIDDKIFEVRYKMLMDGKSNSDKEALEALMELKERLIHRKEFR